MKVNDEGATTEYVVVPAISGRSRRGSAKHFPVARSRAVWGVMTAAKRDGRFPTGAERRLATFTELVETAITNAEYEMELLRSRARVVNAGDEARADESSGTCMMGSNNAW